MFLLSPFPASGVRSLTPCLRISESGSHRWGAVIPSVSVSVSCFWAPRPRGSWGCDRAGRCPRRPRGRAGCSPGLDIQSGPLWKAGCALSPGKLLGPPCWPTSWQLASEMQTWISNLWLPLASILGASELRAHLSTAVSHLPLFLHTFIIYNITFPNISCRHSTQFWHIKIKHILRSVCCCFMLG